MNIESPATLIIITLNVIISIMVFRSREKYFYTFAEWPYYIVKENKYYQLLTSAFLHADYIHLLFNMFTLFSFGMFLEKFYMVNYGTLTGSIFFIAIYFISLFSGSLLTLIFHYRNPDYVAVGASGAVSGVIFSFITFFPTAQVGVFFIPMPAFIFAAIYITVSIFGMKKNFGNIGHEAHLGGAFGGFISTLILIPDAFSVFKSHFLFISLLW
ncbi:MAG: rhomboid family intramembrane serine protease [Ignavibacteria bacterium]|nr:rhomboid family intramembrane serine protease [Ignavibacteria bacterium]